MPETPVTIQTPKVLRVSHSQLQTFDRCLYKWHLSYEQGWKRKQDYNKMTLGAFGHELLAIWYRTKDAKQVKDRALEWINEQLATGETPEWFIKLSTNVLWLVDRYMDYSLDVDKELIVRAVEQNLIVPMETPAGRTFEVQMVLDLIADEPSYRGDVHTWLWDHKFTFGTSFWSETEASLDPQQTLYIAGLRYFDIHLIGHVINMLKAYDYKNKSAIQSNQLFKKWKSYRTDVELDNFLTEVGSIVDRMAEFYEDPEKARYRSLRKDCSWCSFPEICQMGLKGIEVEDLLHEDFVKKDTKEFEILLGVDL